MIRWSEFASLQPELADKGRRLLYRFGVGLGYLATVRADGGPRVHPFCPILLEPGLYGLIGNSPKQRDLLRDPRCAIHSFPSPDRDDEFYLVARATHREDAELEDRVREAMTSTGATSSGDELLFEFGVERALLAEYKERGEPDNWPPRYTRWSAPRRRAIVSAREPRGPGSMTDGTPFASKRLPALPDVVAPDGCDVRVLLELAGGAMAHFELAPGQTARAVTHRSVEEIWFFLAGRGEMWRKQGRREAVTPVETGTCLSIPLGTHFQLRCLGNQPLAAIGFTMPPWPGADEAVQVEGPWRASVGEGSPEHG